MKSILLFFSGVFLLTGCVTPAPVTRERAENNQDYKVDYLFEHDGCKVYRFRDKGNYVYFTNCANQAITMNDSLRVVNSITNH